MMEVQAAVKQGYRECQSLTRKHAKTFYFSSVLLWGERRRAAFALYAFCRRLDDMVDEAPDPAALPQALLQAKGAIHALYDGEELPPGPWSASEFLAVRDAVHRFGIPKQPWLALAEGMAMDVGWQTCPDVETLELYCYRVAGVVGEMMAPVLGCQDAKALAPAVALGRAMQWTNILRDVAEDFRRGRCYLPESELRRFGLSAATLERRGLDERFQAYAEFHLERARMHYRAAEAGLGSLRAWGARRLVQLMSYLYSGILSDIERRGMDVFSGRAHVTTWQKVQALVRLFLPGGLPMLMPPRRKKSTGQPGIALPSEFA